MMVMKRPPRGSSSQERTGEGIKDIDEVELARPTLPSRTRTDPLWSGPHVHGNSLEILNSPGDPSPQIQGLRSTARSTYNKRSLRNLNSGMDSSQTTTRLEAQIQSRTSPKDEASALSSTILFIAPETWEQEYGTGRPQQQAVLSSFEIEITRPSTPPLQIYQDNDGTPFTTSVNLTSNRQPLRKLSHNELKLLDFDYKIGRLFDCVADLQNKMAILKEHLHEDVQESSRPDSARAVSPTETRQLRRQNKMRRDTMSYTGADDDSEQPYIGRPSTPSPTKRRRIPKIAQRNKMLPRKNSKRSLDMENVAPPSSTRRHPRSHLWASRLQ